MTRYGSVGAALPALVACATWFVGCGGGGQTSQPSVADDEALKKNVVAYYRRKANVPPAASIEAKDLKPAKIKGARTGLLSFGGKNVEFTISDDGHYAVFAELEDITADPFAAVAKKIALTGQPGKGPANAKVTIVEYSDFQCPFCSRAYTTMETQVLKEYGDKVRFYHKEFPLGFHPWAEPAAVAVGCAGQQNEDAYWKLYNFIFSNQGSITPQNIKDKAHEGLQGAQIDMAKFDDCFDNKKTLDKVKSDIAEGQSVGVNGTPAFLINGRLVSGAQPFENFKAVIDDELAR